MKIQKLADLIEKEVKGLWGDDLLNGESGIKVIKTNNMTYDGHIDYSDICERKIDINDAKKRFLEKGDLLIEKSGGTKTHSVGYVNYFDGENETYVCNNFILALRPNKKYVSPKYLFYALKYLYESGGVNDCFNKTTGIQNLKVQQYLEKPICVHNYYIQTEMVDLLNSIVSMTNNCRVEIDLLDELTQSKFNETFENAHFTSFELGEISNISSGDGLTAKFISSEKNEEFKYIVYGANGIRGYYTKPNRTGKCILVGRVGALAGNVHYYDGDFFATEHALVVETKSKKVEPEWLFYDLRRRNLFSLSKGVAQPVISSSSLKKEIIKVPPLEIQHSFINFVRLIEKTKQDIQTRIDDLIELFNSKSNEYFGGNE